jgi:hypothetical protein
MLDPRQWARGGQAFVQLRLAAAGRGGQGEGGRRREDSCPVLLPLPTWSSQLLWGGNCVLHFTDGQTEAREAKNQPPARSHSKEQDMEQVAWLQSLDFPVSY